MPVSLHSATSATVEAWARVSGTTALRSPVRPSGILGQMVYPAERPVPGTAVDRRGDSPAQPAPEGPGSVDVLSVSIWPTEEEFRDPPLGVRQVATTGRSRRALYAHTPARLDYSPASGTAERRWWWVLLGAIGAEAEEQLEPLIDGCQFLVLDPAEHAPHAALVDGANVIDECVRRLPEPASAR